MKEHALQNAIRNALAGHALIFRANIGQAWTGDDYRKLPDGRLVITNPRPFSTGLPPGFSDLFGFVPVIITPDMVGQRLAVFAAVEVKTPKGRTTDRQDAFLAAVNDNGGRAGVARTPEDALRIINARR